MPNYSKKYKRIIVFILLAFVVGGFFVAEPVSAQGFGTEYLAEGDLPQDDLRVLIIRIINVSLGVVGTVFLGLILYAGFLWMTSGGSPDQVGKAKKIMINAVTGLVIIFMAFAITRFVFNILGDANGPPGGPTSCTNGQVSGCLVCSGSAWVFSSALPGCSLPGSNFQIKSLETANAGGNNDSDVYLCSGIQAITNGSIDTSTISGNVRLTQGNADIPTSLELTGKAMELIPDSSLSPNTTYTAHYRTTILDNSGLALSGCSPFGCTLSSGEYVWDFTTGTETDPDAPQVTNTTPRSDPGDSRYPDRNISRDATLKVSFSEAVRISTIDDGTGSPVAANVKIQQLDSEGGGVIANLDPALFQVVPRSNSFELKLLAPNLYDSFTWYRVIVQDIEDLCGNKMAAPLIWEFQTNDKAAGIRSKYPSGSNICPNVGVATVSFNTSMYDDLVSISIDNGIISPLGAAIRASDLDPGPYQAAVPGGTWSVDPDSDFRVFTFTFASSLRANSNYAININTDRVIDNDGGTLGTSWNMQVSDAESCSCAPYVSSINPSEGFLGQCVTIKGQCFNGAKPQDPSSGQNAQVSALIFDSVPAVIGGQGANFITTTAPASFAEGDRPVPQVTITYNDTALGSLTTSNTDVDFFVSSSEEATGPCLLDISPKNACFGDRVRLSGLRLGDDPGEGSRSATTDHVSYSSRVVQVPDTGVTNWQDDRIQTLVPSGVVDGDVHVMSSGQLSNGVPFDLACGLGSSCSNLTDSCDPNPGICSSGLSCNPTSCLCERVDVPTGPVVIAKSPTCGQSCTNAAISVDFNRDLDPATVNNQPSSVEVRPCLPRQDSDTTGGDCSFDNLGAEINYAAISYDETDRRLSILPEGNLASVTRYRVILYPSITDTAGLPLSGLNYASTGSGSSNSYSWTFTTKDGVCELAGVSISPVSATATRLSQAIKFKTLAEGSNEQCGNQSINTAGLDWAWDSSDTAVASITSNDRNNDNFTDQEQTALSITEGVTDITASTGGFSAIANLVVNVITCDETTDCSQAGLCGGSTCDNTTKTCTPVINSLSPASGPVGRWTTVRGCYFGSSQGSGQVNFDTTPALFPQCSGGNWQNDEIIVEVPSVSSGSSPVRVITDRGLESNNKPFIVSDTCSGVRVPDSGVPGICNLRPRSGSVNQKITVNGINFGTKEEDGAVTFADNNNGLTQAQQINAWGDNQIRATVPIDAATGEVKVEVNACPSNGVSFTIGIGVGSSCDGDPETPACELSQNKCGSNSGLICEVSSCTCIEASAPSIVSMAPTGTNACRNTIAEVEFSQLMNHASLRDSISLELTTTNAAIISSVRLEDDEDSTTAFVTPESVLESSTSYRIKVSTEAKNIYGVPLNTAYTGTAFITGEEVCKINKVNVTITPPGEVSNRDTFFCAGLDDCPDDQDSRPGNQHQWIAQAVDRDNNPLVASYNWTISDPKKVYEDLRGVSSGNITNSAASVYVTPKSITGIASFFVGAQDSTGFGGGSATTAVVSQNVICNNPWPARSVTPWPYNDPTTDFSFWYCRDQGSKRVCFDSSNSRTDISCSTNEDCDVGVGEVCRDDPSDDLPMLRNPVTSVPGQGILKEFLLLFDESDDAIALRVYDNASYLSPKVWYNRNVSNQGRPQTIEVNGYEAVRDGRTTYINAAQQLSGNSYGARIYVISHNQDPGSATADIFGQLIANFEFTTNLVDQNVCSGDANIVCTSDSDCEAESAGQCRIEATKIRRDLRRVADLGSIRSLLRKYRGVCSDDSEKGCVSNADCLSNSCTLVNETYPSLLSGSFIVGQTTSRWPSWQDNLGAILGQNLPVDPFNTFASCPASFDQEACWDETNRIFQCNSANPNPGSHIYQYEVALGGSSYNLYGNLELDNITWSGFPGIQLSGSNSDACRSYRVSQ